MVSSSSPENLYSLALLRLAIIDLASVLDLFCSTQLVADTNLRKPAIQRKFFYTVDIVVKKESERLAQQLLGKALDIILIDSLAGFSMTLPQQAHQIIE